MGLSIYTAYIVLENWEGKIAQINEMIMFMVANSDLFSVRGVSLLFL